MAAVPAPSANEDAPPVIANAAAGPPKLPIADPTGFACSIPSICSGVYPNALYIGVNPNVRPAFKKGAAISLESPPYCSCCFV